MTTRTVPSLREIRRHGATDIELAYAVLVYGADAVARALDDYERRTARRNRRPNLIKDLHQFLVSWTTLDYLVLTAAVLLDTSLHAETAIFTTALAWVIVRHSKEEDEDEP
jgi:hypothetical protein